MQGIREYQLVCTATTSLASWESHIMIFGLYILVIYRHGMPPLRTLCRIRADFRYPLPGVSLIPSQCVCVGWISHRL